MQVSRMASFNQFSANKNQRAQAQNQPSFGFNPMAQCVSNTADFAALHGRCLAENALGGVHAKVISLPVFHPEKLASDVLAKIKSGKITAHIVDPGQVKQLGIG